MNKRFVLQFSVLLLFFTIAGQAYAQDTLKKAIQKNPAVPQQVYKKRFYQRHHMLSAQVPPATINDSSAKAVQAPPVAPVKVDRSLNGQYQYLLSKTFRYQQPIISAFYKNITDTISLQRKQLKEIQNKLDAQSKTIAGLKTDVNTKDQTLTATNAKEDQIAFLGLSFTKTSYNLLMWGLVLGLGAILTIVILTTAKYKHEAKYRIKLYDEVSEEFQTYKAKANEKEKKLARELQTERNKLDELLGRG